MRDCSDRGDEARACDSVAFQTPENCGLSHHSPGLGALLDQLNDFAIPDELPPVLIGNLSPYLPQLVSGVNFPRRMPRTVALTLGDFLSRGGVSYRGGVNVVERLRARGARDIVLVGTAPDQQLEAVWRRPDEFVLALKKADIELVLGPAFSIYVGRPPIERAANRSRNLAMYTVLADSAIRSVPAVGFVDPHDAASTARWIAKLGLHAVFIDLQSVDSKESWGVVRSALPVFVRVSSMSRIIVNGVGHPDRVSELVSLVSPAELVITNASAAQLARSRQDYFESQRGLVRRRSGARDEQIFSALSRFYHEAPSNPERRYIPLSVQPMML